MENNNASTANRPEQKGTPSAGKGGAGNHRGRNHHRRPPRRPASQEAPAEQVVKNAQERASVADKEKDNKEKNGAPKGGDRNRQRGGRGRGSQHQRGGDRAAEAARSKEEEKYESGKQNSKESHKTEIGEGSFASLSTPSFLSGKRDPLFDDTFLPVHEESRPDPEADRYAAEVLDAEGPLLFRQPVEQELPLEEPLEGEEKEPMVTIVGVRFRRTGKVYFFAPGAFLLKVGDAVVVETARGLEYGEVYRANCSVAESEIVPPLRPVVRVATAEDTRHHEENKQKEIDAFRICQEKIAAHDLDMKLVEAEYTFDNTKLLFYFTSAGRVDFRELVKDLAGVFRTRIELRQIGIRDEAKLLGGLGTCGRPLCCAGFLADFVQVSIKMAKEQNLSLNSTKISGCCGRLMCCLRYESDTYEEAIRLTPAVGSLVQTPDGQGTVISSIPLRGILRVRIGDQSDAEAKTYHRDSVSVLQRAVRKEED